MEVGAAKILNNRRAVLRFVIEKHLPLGLFVPRRTGDEEWLHGVGIESGVIHLGGKRHRGGREVLYLFQAIAQMLHLYRQLRHILQPTARMGADKIGDQLIAQIGLAANLIETPFGFEEKVEGGFAHHLQHRQRGVLRCYLEASAHMME